MSVIGLDFGSHTSSIAIWSEEKPTIEVIADDLGLRSIPTVVAFRGDEIITGQSATAQQHKNASNTFDNIRAMLLNSEASTVTVPQLDKEVSVVELGSHFFRNIHNQIKQQVGTIVRDCVISMPHPIEESVKQRIVESAQAGGLRIKCFIDDCTAALLAHQLDDASFPPAQTIVVDIGWSKSEIALFNISGGLFVPLASKTIKETCGSVFVDLLAAHCAKDFQRKSKFPCTDNKKSMMRLRRECEVAVKALSIGAEATIDIDSLCEGVDFSLKISRARFEDLLTIPFMQLKNAINEVLSTAGIEPGMVHQVCLSGGASTMPRIVSTVKHLFPTAGFLKGRIEGAEAHCIGAAHHAVHLFEQGLIDKAPVDSPVAPCLTRPVMLASQGCDPATVLPVLSVLPAKVQFPATVATGAQGSGCLQVLVGGENASTDAPSLLGEVVFRLEHAASDSSEVLTSCEALALTVSVEVSELGQLNVEVTQDSTGVAIGSLTIPAAAL